MKKRYTNEEIIVKIEDTKNQIISEFKKSSFNAMLISAMGIFFGALLAVLGLYIVTKNINFLWLTVILLIVVAVTTGLSIGRGVGEIIIKIKKRK